MDEIGICKVCHEDLAYIEEEGDWGVYVTCPICGSPSAICEYSGAENKAAAETEAIQMWNMGKIIAESRGE